MIFHEFINQLKQFYISSKKTLVKFQKYEKRVQSLKRKNKKNISLNIVHYEKINT